MDPLPIIPKHLSLKGIPLEELLHDRQECYNELATLSISLLQDPLHLGHEGIYERVESNLTQLKAMHDEMKRRGIEPGVYIP